LTAEALHLGQLGLRNPDLLFGTIIRWDMFPVEIRERFDILLQRIARACATAGRRADSVRLVAVTKTHPVETIQALIDLGVTDIGENRVQEIMEKVPLLRGNFTMHMVGRLQTNKVGKVVPLAHWIQSVDSERLLRKIEVAAEPTGRKIKVLVEVNTSGEESKSGCSPREAVALCELAARSKAVEFRGLMTLGPLGSNERATREAFILLRKLGEQCRSLAPDIELSMGMSGDFEWAIEEGATMVRIGTLLLGERR
jgi:pyridoxal phosphate enzyme (YggS family)